MRALPQTIQARLMSLVLMTTMIALLLAVIALLPNDLSDDVQALQARPASIST